MSIRNKIILLFTTLTAVTVLFLSLFIYLYTRQYIERDFLHRMQVRAGIAAQVRLEGSDENTLFYQEMRERYLQHLPDETVYVFDTDHLRSFFDSLQVEVPLYFYQSYARDGKSGFRNGDMFFSAREHVHDGRNYQVLLSAKNTIGAELLTDLRKNLVIGFIIATAIVLLFSLILSHQLIDPIRNLIRNAKKITATNLHLRLGPREGKDEIAELTRTFNDMLDRLETSFETQNNFLNKAAHELRTPLTAIIGEAELALSRPREVNEYTHSLSVITREAEQLQHHTSSLLELAQAAYSSKETFMSEIRLDELLFAVKRLIDFTEPANQVCINLDALPESENQITIFGNTNLLKLALSNIIQNACKYSEQKKVVVTLSASKVYCIIKVQDQGIGIPENEMKYIFDPFFRASNTGEFRGYGFGLPLAQKIIRLHRGNLEYSSTENVGTTVEIELPYVIS